MMNKTSSKYFDSISRFARTCTKREEQSNCLWVNLGRRGGHTWIAKNILKSFKNAIAIGFNEESSKRICDVDGEKDLLLKNRIFTINRLDQTRGVVVNDSIIVVDTCEAMSGEKLEEIQDLYSDRCKCIIFLG